MQVATRRSVLSIGLVVALLAVAAIVVLPVFAEVPPPDLHLHTNADGVTMFTFDGATQNVGNAKGCLLAPTSGTLISLSAAGRGKPGYVRGIGLKTGGSNGTPCSQVDVDDAGSLVLTSVMGPWQSMELDLELKQNAKIEIKVSGGGHSSTEVFTLNTGSNISDPVSGPTPDVFPYAETVTTLAPAVDCASPSDSGPDSGPNDNCRLTVIPDMTFDTVTIKALAGAVSLEGGADFVAWNAEDQAAGDYDSVFVYAPVATDDTASTSEDSSTTIDVLANDSPGATLLAGSLTPPSSGTVIANGNGTITFDPDGEFEHLGTGDVASVSFTYAAQGVGGNQSTATVTVTVNGVNDQPTIDDSTSLSIVTDEDTSGTLVVGASDPEGAVTVVVVDSLGSGTAVASGTTITYTPNPNDNGSDLFSFEVCDLEDLCSDPVTVTVLITPVNDAPVAVADAYEVNENNYPFTLESSTLVVGDDGVLGNDTDVDWLDSDIDSDPPLSATLITGPNSGTLILFSGGSFTYTPDPGFYGSDTFIYEASDGSLDSNQATVTITVVEVMCTDEPRSHSDGAVFGEFTLLTANICKRYSVVADAAGDPPTVTFSPDGEEAGATFRGVLRFPAETVLPLVNSLALLEYDGDDDGSYESMPVCLNPQPLVGDVTSATIPGSHTWCLVSVTAVADEYGHLAPQYIIFGTGDPIFRVK